MQHLNFFNFSLDLLEFDGAAALLPDYKSLNLCCFLFPLLSVTFSASPPSPPLCSQSLIWPEHLTNVTASWPALRTRSLTRPVATGTHNRRGTVTRKRFSRFLQEQSPRVPFTANTILLDFKEKQKQKKVVFFSLTKNQQHLCIYQAPICKEILTKQKRKKKQSRAFGLLIFRLLVLYFSTVFLSSRFGFNYLEIQRFFKKGLKSSHSGIVHAGTGTSLSYLRFWCPFLYRKCFIFPFKCEQSIFSICV